MLQADGDAHASWFGPNPRVPEKHTVDTRTARIERLSGGRGRVNFTRGTGGLRGGTRRLLIEKSDATPPGE
jgi:hypothetical protein